MTKLKLDLRDLLVNAFGSSTTHVPSTIDVSEILEFNDLYESEIDVHHALAKQRQIALIWGVDDVKDRRPDLNDEQCWQVIATVERQHDCNHGVTWDTIEQTAEDLFGSSNAHRIGRCELALHAYDSDTDADASLVDFLADAMHWCKYRNKDFRDVLRIAEDHYSAEDSE
jgi:hypothetical protein